MPLSEQTDSKAMTTEIRLEIVGLMANQHIKGAYGLVLQEARGNRRFSVLIGEAEAQSIALKLRNKSLPRPLTHELMANLLLTLGFELEKVLIYALVNDLFCAELHIKGGDGATYRVDARTSDSVALAVVTGCPVYIRSDILEQVGTEVSPKGLPETLDDVEDAEPDELKLLGRQTLARLLQQAVEEERYELAAKLKKAMD